MRNIFAAFLLFFSLNCFSQEKKQGEIKLFLEPLSSQSWQAFFLADAAAKKNSYFSVIVKPVVAQKDGKWYSPRGDGEINEAARMAAIEKNYPGLLNKYLTGRSLAPWSEGWRDACVYAGINPLELASFAEKNKEELLKKALKECMDYSVSATSLFVEGVKYQDDISLLPFLKYLNSLLPQKERFSLYEKELASFKTPVLKIIAPSQSSLYNTDQISSIFKRYIPSVKEEKINISNIGKEFSFVKYLPAYILEDDDVVRESLAQAIASGLFEKHGKYFVFYDRNSRMEIRSAKKTPGKLEIFVMSQCPFGVMAENAVIDSFRKGLLDKNTKIEIHYIASEKNDGTGKITFDSLHGEEEWKENARQIYIAKKYPSKFFDYLIERNKNYSQGEWTQAAQKAGLNPLEIENNFDEAKKLLAQDVKIAQALGIGTSPTFLIDSTVMAVGLGELKKTPGYEKISSAQAAPAGGCAK